MERIGAETKAMEDKYDLEAEKIKANFDTIEQRDRDLAKLEIRRHAERRARDNETVRLKQTQRILIETEEV